MSNNFVEALIGALVLVVAGSFIFYTYSRTDIGSVDGYVLTASFDKIDGLDVGGDVRLAGIKVGSVTKQFINKETFRAIVTFTVQNGIKLPTDTMAVISSEGLLGGNYLSLSPGGMDEFLEAGDEVYDTQGSIDLMSLLGKAVFSAVDGDDKETKN
jgi:phospholipid/cholesterol/gamma-HCH transport system substrate-binding protein